MESTLQHANEATSAAWNANAAYSDARMGDAGNDFVNQLIWPAVTHLLALQPGKQVLDIACGNGLYQLLGAGFAAGFVVDGLEERAFAPVTRQAGIRLAGTANLARSHPCLWCVCVQPTRGVHRFVGASLHRPGCCTVHRPSLVIYVHVLLIDPIDQGSNLC